MVQPLWKTVWRFLKKVKIELPYDPANLTPGHISRQNYNSEKYRHPYVHSSNIHNSGRHGIILNVHQQRKRYRRCGTCINGILLSHEKEQNNTICSNMDATRDYHINAK